MSRCLAPDQALESASRLHQDALTGSRICLVRENRLLHHVRYNYQIQLLQQAGATVSLLTSYPDPQNAPPGVERFYAPLTRPDSVDQVNIPASEHPVRPIRIASNLLRNLVRSSFSALRRLFPRVPSRRVALRRIAPNTDLFWVVDYPALESTMEGAFRWGNGRVLYDTVDLVPEYEYYGISPEERARKRETERRLIGSISGFVTAADSYAHYYDEMYGNVTGYRRPVVFGNAPEHVVDEPQRRRGRTRFLFFGRLAFDRPIIDLIASAALTCEDVDVTFQGDNLLGSEPFELIERLEVSDRVRIVPPCALEEIVEVASEYDVGIVALSGADENERRAETTKLYTYMAAGLAILGSKLPGISSVVTTVNNGLLVEGMSPLAWAAAMDEIAGLDDESLGRFKVASLAHAEKSRPSTQAAGLLGEFARALAPGEDGC